MTKFFSAVRYGGGFRLIAALALALAPVLWLSVSPQHAWPVVPETYLPIHTAMEVFSVVVSAMIFAMGWHSFEHRTPAAVAVLSTGFLMVGLLDIGHLLSFPGMPDFVTPSSVEKGIEFWLAARFISAAAILAVAAMPWSWICPPSMRYASLALGMGLVGLVFWVILFHPSYIPDTHIEGRGLTPLKIAAEYLVIGMYLLAAFLLLPRASNEGDQRRGGYLAIAAVILALGELCFTMYFEAQDLANLLGHVYKVVGCVYLYRAIFVSGVNEPYQRLQRSREQLRQSESKFRDLMEFAPDAIFLIDQAGRMQVVNARAESLFGFARGRALGSPVSQFIPSWPQCPLDSDVLCRNSSGQIFHAEISRGVLEADGGALTMAIVRDLTERRKLESALVDQLSHDAMTGLPNRSLILSKLAEAMLRSRLSRHMVAVLFLDLDFFKKVNDTFGHAQGDEVLHETVRRIKSQLTDDELVARQSGDEFIVVQSAVKDISEVSELAERLLKIMRVPFSIQGHDVFLSVSIGIAVYQNDETSEEGLLHKAHLALTNVKSDARNNYRYHAPDMERGLKEKVAIEGLLRQAIDKNELLLHYQPRICMRTGVLKGVEALVRWQQPKLGMIPPGEFIPVAEESGLIDSIGTWVLQEACAQAVAWREQGLGKLRVAVNLSPRQFHYANLVAQVQGILAQAGLEPDHLEIEITESAVMKDTESAINTLHLLKELGVVVSVDDFGTGYSSLSYLKLFPIDILKIDQSFVRDMLDNPSDAAIAKAIIALGQSLRLTVVAEGVETRGQAQSLKALGCDEMQGYYFSRPVPAAQIIEIAQRHSPARAGEWVDEISQTAPD
ncbi:EAL domain-containing protein [Parapusillimonas granuli]|uniref:EAL domain-containing protein n=1 Tax=Parapusillimonas granuli TaxID=380911 RepID=A0A853G1X1_9BURK|nr:diguanylate cyclase (GGDEF)-like protein [Parapusillimonas granuli]MEB2399031.1 EAL domain-containing protein [Alcaligenaceae bacterium]NYT51308.1 EAL domain-containing protein [Parapusillimonas granuli]